MIGKFGVVGAVVLIWVLTYVMMGGEILPPPKVPPQTELMAEPSPSGFRYPDPTPLTPSPSTDPEPDSSLETMGDHSAATEEPSAIAGTVLTPRARPEPKRIVLPSFSFRISTFNMLGSTHTARKGKNPRRASGTARTARAAQYVMSNGISVVGFQELQPDQRSTFLRATGGEWDLYPGNAGGLDGDNSIAWRLADWEMVKPGSVPIPYFNGRPRNMPVILLRNKKTGISAYFTNFHNPASTKSAGNQARWRAAAKSRQAQLFGDLKDDGYPVFVTGDMNETQSWFCEVAGPGDLRAAAGGDGARDGCSVAGGHRVDWIAASHDVQFSNYREDRSGVVEWMTDHPVMIADALVDGRFFPRSIAGNDASQDAQSSR